MYKNPPHKWHNECNESNEALNSKHRFVKKTTTLEGRYCRQRSTNTFTPIRKRQ